MKLSYLFLLALNGSCLLAACGGGGRSDRAAEPTAHLTVTAPPTATAGTAFNVMVSALDAANQVVAGYSRSVHFSSTDRQAVLPANSKMTNGTGSFSATLGTGGSQNITATDTVTASITGTSSAIDVSDPATHLSVSAPSTAVSGTHFKLTVTALDAANKIVAGYSGTVHFSSSDPQAVLPYNSKVTNGTGEFYPTLRTAGSQTIRATDTVTASIAGTSNSVAVSVYRNCLAEGAQCLSSYPPCCSGLVCRAATTRAYCEPASAAAGSAASKAATRLAAVFPQAPPASPNNAAMHHHYKLIDMGTLGGPVSYVNIEPFQNVLNNAGVAVGGADTAVSTSVCYNPVGNNDCYVSHGFAWVKEHLEDLGTLKGGNFSLAAAINRRGVIAGVSENDQLDPVSGNPEFRGVLWRNGKIRDLGTLGGVSSVAFTLNDHDEVIGVALNDVPDPYSMLGMGSATTLTETRAFLWRNGEMLDLGTLGGPDSWAVYVNDRGQVAGTSYTSSVVNPNTGMPPLGVFLWEKGEMRNLGDLGADNGLQGPFAFSVVVSGLNNRGEVTGQMVTAGNGPLHAFLWNGAKLVDLGTLGGSLSLAEGINDRGEVVGVAALMGDSGIHAFVTQNGKMRDLGTAGGYDCSVALNINSVGQVIGALTSAMDGCNAWRAAFLWEDGGPMVDLNSLIPAGSPLVLFAAFSINDRGEILGQGMPRSCTDSDTCPDDHAFLLIPCDDNHPDIEGCDYSPLDMSTVPGGNASLHATPHKRLTPKDLSRIRSVLINRHRGFTPRTIH